MKKKLLFLMSLVGMVFSTNISATKVAVINEETANAPVMIMGDI